jgi:hypothetical protein
LTFAGLLEAKIERNELVLVEEAVDPLKIRKQETHDMDWEQVLILPAEHTANTLSVTTYHDEKVFN